MKKVYSLFKCIIIALVFVLFQHYVLGSLRDMLAKSTNNLYLGYTVGYILASIILICFLYYIKKQKVLVFSLDDFRKGLKVGKAFLIICILYLVMSLLDGFASENDLLPLSQIIFFILFVFGIGFTEEVLCRGIIQNILRDSFGNNKKSGIYLSIILASIIFGCIHFINIFTTSATIEYVIPQVIVTSAIGLLFGAFYACSDCIWTSIILHGLWDMQGMIEKGFWGIESVSSTSLDSSLILAAVLFLVCFIYFFVLLKKYIK